MTRRLGAAGLSVLLWAGAAAADPPPLTNNRYDEDYSALRTPAARTGAFWEPFKAIPLAPAEGVWLDTGAELRLRYEGVRNSGWGQDQPANDRYILWRALPYADLTLGPQLRLFGQLVAADALGKDGALAPPDADRLDLLQGFGELRLPLSGADATLRVGRRMLAFGSERLIGYRYGPNVPRSFDMASAAVTAGLWRAEAVYGRPVRVNPEPFDDQHAPDRRLAAVYGTYTLGARTGIDAYWIGLRTRGASFDQGTADERRHTLGTRLFGRSGSWDWNWEAMGQVGRFGDGDIRAWSLATETGYRWSDAWLAPRLGLKANIASGDHDPDDRALNTFDPLFPKGKYFGELTPIGPYNLINLHPTLDLDLSGGFGLGLAAVAYWRESGQDGVYDVTGNLLRSGAGSDARYVGTQGEIVLSYSNGRTFEAMASYSLFRPGAFIEDTGPARTIHFVGLEAVLKF